MQGIIEVLEQKLDKLRRGRVIKAQLAENPREPFDFALRKELAQLNSEIAALDEVFLTRFSECKRRCGLAEGEALEVYMLSDADKNSFRKIQALIREIRSF